MDSILFIILGFKVEVGLLNSIMLGCMVKVWVIVICCCCLLESWEG